MKKENIKSIQVKNSYRIWKIEEMDFSIENECRLEYNSYFPEILLNRSFLSMYIEWWLHNIGYYITKPFCSIEFFKKINLRCKDVDLEERKKNGLER